MTNLGASVSAQAQASIATSTQCVRRCLKDETYGVRIVTRALARKQPRRTSETAPHRRGINYFRRHAHRMDYPRLRRRHLPIGSGVGEGTEHNIHLQQRLRAVIAERRVPAHRYEFAMLYGIQSARQLALARAGEGTRCLVSYGEYWFPWYMRRLAERPANVWFVVKNLFRR